MIKHWYKTLVIAVVGAFLLPNTAKLIHIVEGAHSYVHTHQCSGHHHHNKTTTKASEPELKSYQSGLHSCYICNFHYSGFYEGEGLQLKQIIQRLEARVLTHYKMCHEISAYTSKQLRAPPCFA